MNIITVLEAHFPRVVAQMIVEFNLEPTLISHGISFDDKDSRENGITVAVRYTLSHLHENGDDDHQSHRKLDFSHPINSDIWDTVVRSVKNMGWGNPLTGFRLDTFCTVEVVDGEVIILGKIVDPIRELLEELPHNEDSRCVDCYERHPIQGTNLCPSCIPNDYIFPMDCKLKERVETVRLSVESITVSERIAGSVKTILGAEYFFSFDRAHYSFSNRKEESKRIRQEI